jgi:hypothetical protein
MDFIRFFSGWVFQAGYNVQFLGPAAVLLPLAVIFLALSEELAGKREPSSLA